MLGMGGVGGVTITPLLSSAAPTMAPNNAAHLPLMNGIQLPPDAEIGNRCQPARNDVTADRELTLWAALRVASGE